MVKPRVAVGSTNTASNSTYKPRMAVYDSHTFKDTVPKKKKTNSMIRTMETSTWKVDSFAPQDYSTEKNEKYRNPRTQKIEPSLIVTQDPEDKRRQMQEKAVKKFEALAMKRYGNMENLFKAFKKGPSDILTLDEFSEHLRKRNMDLYFPRDEQRLLFENLDKTHTMRLPVSEIILKSQADAKDGTHLTSRFETEVKDLIIHKIDEQRGKEKLAYSPREAKKQLVRTLRNLDPDSTGYISKDKLKWALGERYLNLKLSDEEVQAAVDLCPPSSRTGEVSYDKFIRLLNLRNGDPISDPFFDAKASNISRLKQRIQQLTELENDEALLKRRDELLKICMVGPGPSGISMYLDPKRKVSIPPIGASPMRDMVETQERRHDEARGSQSNEGSPSRVNSQPQSPLQHFDSSSYFDDTSGYYDDSTEHFRPTVNHPSRTKVKYPMTIDLADAHANHKESVPVGRRRGPEMQTNWGLIRHDHNEESSSNTLNASASCPAFSGTSSSQLAGGSSGAWDHTKSTTDLSQTQKQYRSAQAEYYTPLEYKPSMPVTRPGVIGDAMKAAMEREERRRRRYARTQANMKAVNDLVELERISQQLNESKRSKGRVIEALQYEKTSFHKDIASHGRRPGGTYMQKKSHPELYTKMWGGNLGREKATIEDRDFNTTYGNSFIFPDSASSTIQSGTARSGTESFPLGE